MLTFYPLSPEVNTRILFSKNSDDSPAFLRRPSIYHPKWSALLLFTMVQLCLADSNFFPKQNGKLPLIYFMTLKGNFHDNEQKRGCHLLMHPLLAFVIVFLGETKFHWDFSHWLGQLRKHKTAVLTLGAIHSTDMLIRVSSALAEVFASSRPISLYIATPGDAATPMFPSPRSFAFFCNAFLWRRFGALRTGHC